MGCGLIKLPATVIVSTYFKKKRALASSLASCGSGVGTLIMAPIISTLDNNFGWASTMMMIGGLMLACVPLGLVFRPIENKKLKTVTAQHHNALDTANEENSHGCSIFLRRLTPKCPAILHDTVFIICLLSNFLTNLGFAVPYVYTVVC